MSYRELAKSLIDQIPEGKLFYIVSYLQGAVVPDDVPNAETVAAMQEVGEMIRTGSGQHFTGSTEDFFAMLDAEGDEDA